MRWTKHSLRMVEANSLADYVASTAHVCKDAVVLDYGCGHQPYRDIVMNAGATAYVAYDRADYPGTLGVDLPTMDDDPLASKFDVILCTQIVQYVPDVPTLLARFADCAPTLVLTYPTTWPEVEPDDIHRFTKHGMERLLHAVGYTDITSTQRAAIPLEGFELALGYGVLAQHTPTQT